MRNVIHMQNHKSISDLPPHLQELNKTCKITNIPRNWNITRGFCIYEHEEY